jgi:cyclic nucleotide gated channel
VVQNLENHGDQNLPERICEYLKPKYYNENKYILREGVPLTEMVFITKGSVYCFKSSNGHGSDQPIDKFELYGEELVQSWLNHYPSHKELPTSTKTVKTHSKVEAFVLTASNLKHLVPMHTRAASAVKAFCT